MPSVRAVYVSPVKSLRLGAVEDAAIGPHGIAGDRLFALVDGRGRVVTLRVAGGLARVESRYDAGSDTLSLRFPDGVEDGPAAGREPMALRLWDRQVEAAVVPGPWTERLSALAGRPVRLVRVDAGIRASDAYPVSLLSQAAADELARRVGVPAVDPRRFRPTLLLEDVAAHGEDAWIGRRVAVGDAVLRVVAHDVRCSLTQRNPETGERDADTLRWLAAYRRTDEGGVTFGVYADVERPGRVRPGDTVTPLDGG